MSIVARIESFILAMLWASFLLCSIGVFYAANANDAPSEHAIVTEVGAKASAKKVIVPLLNKDPAQDIIEQQLKAFRDRDATLAFELTSDKIRTKYDDDEKRYLQMMRYLYRPLYENDSYTFLESAVVGEAHIQKLELIDLDGDATIVIYRIVPGKKDGTWLVDGYTLLEAESEPI